ncbi:histidine kinase [Flavitalea flava]
MNLAKLFFPALLTSVIQLIGCEGLLAQDINESNFTLYTKQQGLSHNNVTGMVQDSTGYFWITTSSGLNRFNGSCFVQYHSSNDNLSLPSEQLNGVVWLNRQRLATYGDGLHIIDTRTGETRNLFVPYSDKQYQYKFNWVVSVTGNEQGDIFLLTRSGFYQFDKNYRLVFRYDHYTKEEVATSTFGFGRNQFWLDKNTLVLASIAGIYVYLIDRHEYKKMTTADCPLLREILDYPKKDCEFFQQRPGCFFLMNPDADSLVYLDVARQKRTVTRLPFHSVREQFDYRSELSAINDSLLYITGNLSGFYKMRLHPESGQLEFLPKKYFPFYYCRHLLQDRDQNLWVATNKGLFSQDNSQPYVQIVPVPSQLEALYPGIVVDDIAIAGDKLFAASRKNGGLLVFDRANLNFIRRIGFKKYGNSADNVYSVVAANDSILFIGTNGPLFRLNTRTNALAVVELDKWNKGDWISYLWKDKTGNIWVASENMYRYEAATGHFSIVPTKQGLFEKIEGASNLGEDLSGNIWIAGHGLVRYNIRYHTFDRLIDSFPYIKIPDRQVNTFVIDPQNNIWLNSNNNGLICYRQETGTFLHFTRDNGLPDNNIASLIVVRNKLWIASYSGIACLDLQTFRISSFEKEDGFPDQPIVNGSKFYFDSANNKLLIGFTNTLVQFDPGIIFQKRQAPQLFFEYLTTGNQQKFCFPKDNITTSWRNNGITISIGSINFFTGNSQRFSYRLVKEDSTPWQQLGTQNTFSVSSLAPGRHKIQVKLFSLNNRWPEQIKEMGITIFPPFWKQTWFVAVFLLLLLITVYLVLIWRIRHIRIKERAKTHIQELKAEDYKSQFELEQISNYFSSSLASKKNVDQVLWDVMRNLISRMNYEDCIIYLWNEDRTRMIQKAAHGPKGNPNVIYSQQFDVLPGQGLVGHVMQTREPLLVADTRKDPRYRVDDMNRLSEVCVPIIHNNELIGVIDSEHHCVNYFRERDIQILTTIATLVGNKISQLESEQSLELKQKEIAVINQQLAEAQLSALQTQMNPHFIFNSLNSIKGMILDNEQQKASRYLSKFAHMIRITLNQSKEVFTTLYENIEHVESYLVMEKLRFDDSFSFKITVDDLIDKEEILIPTLMIQPLAENAIWHGLMPKKGKKNLSIRFSRTGGAISCIIEDNGIGVKASEQMKQLNRPLHRSVGLNNLRNRIKILNEKYDTGCTLTLMDLDEGQKEHTGTRAVLRFNIIITKP